MKVLLVEPDRILGATLVEQLSAAGHDVVWRHSAQTALDSLDETLPGAVILELQLGIHNGIEFFV